MNIKIKAKSAKNPLKGIHHRMSGNQARIQLALLGILAGILAGIAVNLFRFTVEFPFTLPFINLHHDDFESLSKFFHLGLPIGGCLIIGYILHSVDPRHRKMGVTHVIDKAQNEQGNLPVKNALLQFLCASLALLSGQSCGREGPAIHVGATTSSVLGKTLRLPNNSIRLLIACGSAAGISASFNTPIAGVIFSMEVIMMEYSTSAFIPVIISAVSGAVVTQILYGSSPVFEISRVQMNSLWEIPYVVLMGIILGFLAACFIWIQRYFMRFPSIDIRLRLLAVGVLTGIVALFIPEVMGTGYDTLNQALMGELGFTFLLIILISKILVTGTALGLGLPGGVIGPTLMIGGIAGGLMGILGDIAMSSHSASTTFYVLLGMCAMMGAVLQAPLAALTALIELSNNPNIILPSMLIIVVANLTTSELFGLQSIFQISLQQQGIKTPRSLTRMLNRYGVSPIMNAQVKVLDLKSTQEELEEIDAEEHEWLVLDTDDPMDMMTLVKTEDFKYYNQSLMAKKDDSSAQAKVEVLKLLKEIPNTTMLVPISIHSTLQEAMEILENCQLEKAYVYTPLAGSRLHVLGIISLSDIISFYKRT